MPNVILFKVCMSFAVISLLSIVVLMAPTFDGNQKIEKVCHIVGLISTIIVLLSFMLMVLLS